MAAKIITALILLLVNLGAGFSLLMMLGLALNGFSERETNWSFIVYIVGALLFTILSIVIGILAVHFLIAKKGFNAILSTVGVSVLFSIFVVIADFVLMLAGTIIAGEIRNSRLS